MIDLVNFGRQKDHLHAENGGFRNGTQQDLNKMVDIVKFGGQKDCPDAELLTLKEGVQLWTTNCDGQSKST